MRLLFQRKWYFVCFLFPQFRSFILRLLERWGIHVMDNDLDSFNGPFRRVMVKKLGFLFSVEFTVAVQWNLFLVAFVVWLYWFHAPHRYRVRRQTEHYNELTKLMQLWCGIHFIFFHTVSFSWGRGVAVSSDPQAAHDSLVSFFPLVLLNFVLLWVLHRNRWVFGSGSLEVTYVASRSIWLLNTFILSLLVVLCRKTACATSACVSTALHELLSCSPIEGRESREFWRFGFHAATSVGILALELLYRRLLQTDPRRGILWAELVFRPQPVVKLCTSVRPEKSHRRNVFEESFSGSFLAPPHEVLRVESKRNLCGPKALSNSDAPRGKPMVPWYKPAIASTGLQLLLGTQLSFLSFDVRALAPHTKPKVFVLRPSVPFWMNVPSPSRKILRSHKTNSASVGSSQISYGESPFLASSDTERCCASTDEKGLSELWFDFTADVGDGFNSTYEIARLLAQPQLTVRNTSPKKKFEFVERLVSKLQLSVKNVKHRFVSSDTGLHRASCPDLFPNRTSTLGELHRVGRSPQRKKVATRSASADVPVKSDSLAENVLLPRGAFLLIGGDLAYPYPSPNSFKNRLFYPYKEAFPGDGNLRRELPRHMDRFIRQDTSDPDTATIHLQPTYAFDELPQGHIPRRVSEPRNSPKSGTTESENGNKRNGNLDWETVVRSTPLAFIVPGNHDWIDGLRTYSSHILGKSWLGGWHTPQRSSYFILQLPAEWVILGLDGGIEGEIDSDQLRYMLDWTTANLTERSSVIVINHIPSWHIQDYNRLKESPQPRVEKLCRRLGPRLRMRLCGDVHNYSRMVGATKTNLSEKLTEEAPTLVISGGGGAFLHGVRDVDHLNFEGVQYFRKAAFPSTRDVVSLFSQAVGFRIVNWQFDVVGGALYILLMASLLPLPLDPRDGGTSLAAGSREGISLWSACCGVTLTVVTRILELLCFILTDTAWTLGGVVLVCGVHFAILESRISLSRRIWMAVGWGLAHVVGASLVIIGVQMALGWIHESGLVRSSEQEWRSVLEDWAVSDVSWVAEKWDSVGRSRGIAETTGPVVESQLPALPFPLKEMWRLGFESFAIRATLPHSIRAALMQLFRMALRLADPLEGLLHFTHRVSVAGKLGVVNDSASRLELVLYAVHLVWFLWLLMTPVTSLLVGSFLACCRWLDMLYDPTYSALQIEDYKHFCRFRLDVRQRTMEAFVVGVQDVPTRWMAVRRGEVETERGSLPPTGRRTPESGEGRLGGTTLGSTTAETESAASWAPPHWDACPHRWRPFVSTHPIAQRLRKARGFRGSPILVDHFTLCPTPLKRGTKKTLQS